MEFVDSTITFFESECIVNLEMHVHLLLKILLINAYFTIVCRSFTIHIFSTEKIIFYWKFIRY